MISEFYLTFIIMVSPTLESYMLGYWLFIKKHPEYINRKFDSYRDFLESGIYSVNTCVGLDGGFFKTLEDASIMCSRYYHPNVYMTSWNLLIEHFDELDSVLESLFRGRLYEYKEILSGRRPNKIIHITEHDCKQAVEYLQEINDEALHFPDDNHEEYEYHCDNYRENCHLINRLLAIAEKSK